VITALADGSLPQKKWERYLAQKQESKFADDKAGYMQEKKEWHKEIAMWSKQYKKSGGLKI
jgi:sulfur relay (sulfurtransferase) DsrC/TusE family protein